MSRSDLFILFVVILLADRAAGKYGQRPPILTEADYLFGGLVHALTALLQARVSKQDITLDSVGEARVA
ncbi:hypothetical protein [Bradyrhizobium retamae]|uniref:Uncharacterized protein n=1 Tax=Bradyrhizobium retamae TaxID=1300035 RepID=A0A0R3MDD8_9BRAD|nr:hypothetical protein [Bradyrhizobium retamae]KRR18280.1 hypothetical protein CQ13_35280 [Bradyrhizobium retamae]